MTKPITDRPLEKPGPADFYTTIVCPRFQWTHEKATALRAKATRQGISIQEALRRGGDLWLKEEE
jgi:hypothetical protein